MRVPYPPGTRVSVYRDHGAPPFEGVIYLIAANGVWLETDDGRKVRAAWWRLSRA